MNAGIAAYVILSQNTDVTNIVGVNIFPEVAEQETATPFIVYQLLSVAPEDTHDGPSTLDEVRFEFLCYADSYALAADLGSKVRGALDRVSGTYNSVNVESIQFNDVDIDTIDAPRRFAQVLTFTFRIKRDNFTIAQGTPVTGAKLGDLYDVDVAGVTDGQFIKYVAAQQEWQAADSAGGVTSLAALTDVNLTGLGSKDVINYNSITGKWEPVDFLNVLYTNLKTGVSTTINDGANTNSALELGATTAKLKTGISEILITETSPGDIDFIVATDGSGTTPYTALNIDGSTSANEAILNIPVGTQLHIKSPTHYAYLRYSGGANASLSLPTSSGTIARTADIAIDAAVAANTAKISYTDASAVAANTAKVGITTQQASDITTNNAKTGITSGQASAITANTAKVSYTDGAVDLRIAAADIGDLNDVPASLGTTGQVLAVNTGATALEYVDQSGGGGITFDYARAIMSASVLQGGASQQDFDSATPQTVKFDTSADTEGTGITIDTTNNRITVGATGYYQLTSNISFNSPSAQRTTPATSFRVNGTTELLGEGYGYIRASTQFNNNNLVTCIVELQANDYVEVRVADSTTRTGSLFATQAFFEVSSTGGSTGAAGPQGPSGTTYDVVTLTGSTILSSAHTTKYLVVDSSSAVNITVPASASYDANAEFVIEQRGAGAVTVVAASGVTINSSETLISGRQYAVMGLKRTASNVYTLTGERQAS